MHKLALAIALAVGVAGRTVPAAAQSTPLTDLSQVKNIVVIFAENRGFDHLYGTFPGANGIGGAQSTQLDRNGQLLATLPPIGGSGLTQPSDPTQVTTEMTRGRANGAYALDDPHGYNVSLGYKLHDLVHSFYIQQMQINGGGNDKFAAWSDAGGEVMGYFDGSKMALWQVAKKYTLADNFFQGAFGGSFLNHQYLICACAPFDFKTAADPVRYAGLISSVAADGASLKLDPASPASALDGPPKYVSAAALSPDFFAVNTMQPPYQPSAVAPASGGDARYADPGAASALSAQGATTIGDLLSEAGVDWRWYGGAWQAAIDNPATAYAAPTIFQSHHQPFNYYARYAPGTAARAAHLVDGGLKGAAFIADIDAGRLPPVAFYKPEGGLNEHAGYANVNDGDAHIAGLISHLEKSPQWSGMIVVVTYDENGGWWDHAAPPRGDRWGPGTRIPAIVVSPFARRGFVDHTQYDTASILRFITRRFALPQLPGLQVRDLALARNGQAPMGDLTAALDMPFAIDAGMTGLWYDPAQSGHGFQIEVLPGDVFVMYWYTFDAKGNPAWFGGVGTIKGDTASVLALRVSGGLFPPAFDPAAIVKSEWGTLDFRFSGCNAGRVEWQTQAPGFSSGGMDIKRLSSPVKSLACH